MRLRSDPVSLAWFSCLEPSAGAYPVLVAGDFTQSETTVIQATSPMPSLAIARRFFYRGVQWGSAKASKPPRRPLAELEIISNSAVGRPTGPRSRPVPAERCPGARSSRASLPKNAPPPVANDLNKDLGSAPVRTSKVEAASLKQLSPNYQCTCFPADREQIRPSGHTTRSFDAPPMEATSSQGSRPTVRS